MGLAPVGIAQGRIEIDLQNLARQRDAVIREARLMGDGFKREIGGALGVLAGLGVASAQSVKALEARFRLLAGSEEAAVKQMDMLRAMAQKTGQPFLKVVEGATALMPALRNSNAELGKTLLLTQRLAILDPAQGVEGAAFAIREFLSGEYLSLVRRLELDRGRLQQIRDESGGDQQAMIQGLSDYIDELGVTEDALYSMGQEGLQSFAILKSEATETAADVFEPFLNDVLIPLVSAFADLMRELRQVNPELKKFLGIAAGLGGVAAAGSQGLPIVGRIPGGGAIARGAGIAAAGYGGVQAGAFVARQVSPELQDKSQQDVVDLFVERFKQMIVIAADTWNKLDLIVQTGQAKLGNAFGVIGAAFQLGAAEIGNALATLVDAIGDGAAAILEGFAKFLEGLEFSQTFDFGLGKITLGVDFGSLPDDLKKSAEGARALEDGLRTSDETMQQFHDRIDRGIDLTEEQTAAILEDYKAGQDNVRMLGEWLGVIEETRSAGEILGDTLGRVRDYFGQIADQALQMAAANSQDLNITDDLLDEWEQLQTDLTDLEVQYNKDQLQETIEFEERKADLIKSYQDRVTQIVEDAQIAYQRALETAIDKEAQIRQDMADTIAESDEEYAETIRDLNEEYRQADADALKDHLDRLQQIRVDGQRAISSAVAHLDAVELFEATQAMHQKLKAEQDSFSDEREQRRRRYREALEDANEAHDEQIAAAKEHAEEEIDQLWERFNKEQRLREQDTQRRLNQLRKEHNDRMMELYRQHDQRMAELSREYGQERSALLTHFAQTLLDQNQHLGNLRDIEAQHRQQLEEDLRQWWEDNGYLYMPPDPAPATTASAGGGGSIITADAYQEGGPVRRTGRALVHAGEYVLNPTTTSRLSRMLGQDVTQRGLLSAVSGAGGRGATIEQLNIQMPQTGRQWTRFEIEQFVDERISAALGAA